MKLSSQKLPEKTEDDLEAMVSHPDLPETPGGCCWKHHFSSCPSFGKSTQTDHGQMWTLQTERAGEKPLLGAERNGLQRERFQKRSWRDAKPSSRSERISSKEAPELSSQLINCTSTTSFITTKTPHHGCISWGNLYIHKLLVLLCSPFPLLEMSTQIK